MALREVGGHPVITSSLQEEQSTATVFHGILAKPFIIRHLLILFLRRCCEIQPELLLNPALGTRPSCA